MEKAANKSNDDDDEDEDDEDWDEADDDGKIYKNPRNLPSSDCPRDEEQATLLVSLIYFLFSALSHIFVFSYACYLGTKMFEEMLI